MTLHAACGVRQRLLHLFVLMLDMGQTKVEGVDKLVGASLALIHIYKLGKESTSHCTRRPDVRRRIFEKIDSVHFKCPIGGFTLALELRNESSILQYISQ